MTSQAEEVARSHDGSIAIKSTRGEDTTVTMKIRLHTPDAIMAQSRTRGTIPPTRSKEP